ncbi:asparaginyl-tRNA synthetase [Monoraphidium neglectum]|uniref:Asparaginyl-tRNA synthetase n=1 Tax=Monoraphidium neglectum TaxID=145388 RepID=A0A0D2MV79_9CHLO|nr:asparaginyl-tRNA synthetase [Monoraphidium neglectum]KIZ06445.1 asparaginyl-tRNA synthetase [Monoraphidium neglectum]|eukprot:XP_013905464.1 asparaginyl-tRNA synthetase [Monoraphidium neglectum]
MRMHTSQPALRRAAGCSFAGSAPAARPPHSAAAARRLATVSRAALDVAEAPATTAAGATTAARERREFKPRVSVRELLRTGEGAPAAVGDAVEVKGWVRTVRNQKQFAFMQVNDGSNLSGIQAVLEPTTPGFDLVASGAITTGASVRVTGVLAASVGAKQAVEIKATAVELVGGCDAEAYPLQKKRHTLEFLRSIAHLRPRTNTLGAVARVRSALAHATHDFFGGAGFQLVHTPILSASDCEGAGEMFQVTTLLSHLEQPAGANGGGAPKPEELDAARHQVSQQGLAVKQAKEGAKAAAGDAAAKQRAEEAVRQLLALKEKLAAMEAAASSGQLPRTQGGGVDYGRDFFGEKTFLTVSGQLNGEMYACAMGDIYTFGPTFRRV